MRTAAGRIAASVLASVAGLCMVVACGQAPLPTPPPAVVSVRETVTVPPLLVTVHAAETANAVAFIAQTAVAQAGTRTALTAPPLAPIAAPPTPSPTPTPTPVPPTPTAQPTLAPAPGAATAAYPLISAVELTQRPERYENVPFSVIGYASNVHARKGTTTFFLASDEKRSNRIFVSLHGDDSSVQENARLQVSGTGAKTIRVVTNGDEEIECPLMRAVAMRPAR